MRFTLQLTASIRVATSPAARFAAPTRHAALYARPYSTEPVKKATGPAKNEADGSNTWVWYAAAATAAVGAAGYYYYYMQPSSTDKSNEKASASSAPLSSLNPKEFIPFKLRETQEINHNTKLFRFDLPSENHILGLPITSAVVTRTPNPNPKSDKDQFVVRPYTPTSPENTRGYFDFIIKRYQGGVMSEHIHSLKPGDTIEVKGPIPKYPYEKGKLKTVGMVAGGTGITPMLQLLRKIFSDPTDTTRVSLIFANVTEEDILLRSELDKLAEQHPEQFKVYYTLDKPPKGWKGGKGFVNDKMVKECLPSPQDDGVIVFVCGPPGMVSAVAGPKKGFEQGEIGGVLQRLGYNNDKVFKF